MPEPGRNARPNDKEPSDAEPSVLKRERPTTELSRPSGSGSLTTRLRSDERADRLAALSPKLTWTTKRLSHDDLGALIQRIRTYANAANAIGTRGGAIHSL